MRISVLLDKPGLLPALVAAGVLLVASGCDNSPPQNSPAGSGATGASRDASLIALNNRGVALMGYFDYAGAREVFAQVVEQAPGWHQAQVNLAIATLNRQQPQDETLALQILQQVLDVEPSHVRANYVAGLLRLYLGEFDQGSAHFEQVLAQDADDAYAHYYLGQIQAQQGQLTPALDRFEQAIALQPYLSSSYYGAALALRRLDRADEARELLGTYQRLEDNPRARLAEFKYTRMGPKANALASGQSARPLPALPDGELFASAEQLLAGDASNGYLSTADIDGDGTQDLFLAGPDGSRVLLAGPSGYAPVETHPLAGIKQVRAALWGDIDNDGNTDVYLCRDGGNLLWLQRVDESSSVQWELQQVDEVTDGSRPCADAGLFDADHDGDLDIFIVNANGEDVLLNNNLDGTFRRLENLPATAPAAPETVALRQQLAVDLDGDRDVDIVVLNADAPHVVLANDRLWQYRAATGFERFVQTPAVAITAGDVDTDGRVELYTRTVDGALWRWLNDADDGWVSSQISAPAQAGPGILALQDFDGDGQAELFSADAAGWRVLRLGGAQDAQVIYAAQVPGASALPLLESVPTGPSVMVAGTDGLQRWRPGPGRYPFAAFSFSGKEEQAESMRSNASGVGTRVSLRNGSHWSVTDTFDKHSGPGQSLQPLSLGLRGAEMADYIALDWSDGVFQTELQLAAGERHQITETQRQLASCPVLFAWDGNEYRFVTDLLGVGGIGFFASPGKYNTPRPWEHVLLPEGALAAREGMFELKLTEPMEEIAYIDSLALAVHDVPPGWQMILDERMATDANPPSGEPVFFRRSAPVQQALNERGEDVTEAVLHADLSAAPPGALDARFLGRLADEHVLTLTFEQPLAQGPGQPVLAIDGWVEYPYSQTVFAAWQADAFYQSPTLEAQRKDGEWVALLPAFGYPAGMPRGMSVALNNLPDGTRRLRLRSNLEIYWDRIRVVYSEPAPEGALTRVLGPDRVRLSQIGFPQRTNGAQRVPDYEYSKRDAYWDTRYQAGYYTRFGPVTELVMAADDALLIVGPGEEAHMQFADTLPTPAAGFTRRYELRTHGYAKDMDMYTHTGETVGPLPVTDPSPTARARADALHRRYHVRYLSGR